MLVYLIIAGVSWLVLGLGGSGFLIAYEKRRWPDLYRPSNSIQWYLMACGGPACLITGSIHSDYGWTLDPRTER